MPRSVIIVDYDPCWPAQAEAMRKVLAKALGDVAQRIEHVGSTSVPGLAAKPIIDLTAVIESPQQLPVAIERLDGLGYVHRGDQGIVGREVFRAREGTRPDTWPAHHLYVCAEGAGALRDHLVFRDWLRGNVEDRDRYGALKRELALRYRDDREGYGAAKTGFVEGVLRRAMST